MASSVTEVNEIKSAGKIMLVGAVALGDTLKGATGLAPVAVKVTVRPSNQAAVMYTDTKSKEPEVTENAAGFPKPLKATLG